MTPQLPLMTQPPAFCEYAAGPCDQVFDSIQRSEAIFLYPSEPAIIAATIDEAVQHLRTAYGSKRWLTWKEFGTPGQIIFCAICKALRFTNFAAADVTTLNFNLLFEIGFAIGLGVPVLPLRDTSYVKDEKIFNELGLIDTLGYIDFENSAQLVSAIRSPARPSLALPQPPAVDKERPLFLVKSPVHTEGMVRLMSALKKSGLRFRSFDARESARLSLHECFRQACSSMGVVMHLMAPHRRDALTHNSRCAFVAGMAMAAGRQVLMLQETHVPQPIDYRDVVRFYNSPRAIPDLLIPFVRSVVGRLQEHRFVPTSLPLTPLEKIDLGDVAAENEILALRSYFVPTGQYNEAKRGHARLVIGRKGSGKTAIFYAVRSAYWQDRSHVVLDLKPEGHQLTKLRETILNELSPGLQQHVLTAFWNYLLLMEIAHKILSEEEQASFRDRHLREAYEAVRSSYGLHAASETEQGDFSERLLALVDSIVKRRELCGKTAAATSDVTALVYSADIRSLSDSISAYLGVSRKDAIWLLFENLDKGWPILDIRPEDVTIVKGLLEATRKLQRQFANRAVELHSVVFLRNDIYDHLIRDPADRGKDNPVILDWNDAEALKEMLRRRIVTSTELEDSFDELWRLFFASHILGEESFSYILGRTLMRPREVLHFVRECITVAVNRGHEQVKEEDIAYAEQSYSDDSLVDLSMELKDINPRYGDVPYAFIGARTVLIPSEIGGLLDSAGVPINENEKVKNMLLWFGFLGIFIYPEEERYSYQFEHNLQKMRSGAPDYIYCIHPAFRKSLGCILG